MMLVERMYGVVLALGLLLAAPASAQTQRLNDTGQITCYSDSTSAGALFSGTPNPEAPGFNEQDCTRGAVAADALGRMVKVGGSTAPKQGLRIAELRAR